MSSEHLSYFEDRLTKEIEEIEAKIKRLEAAKRTLVIQKSKARAERAGLSFSTRKNSMNRVLAENAVIEALRKRAHSMSTAELYQEALVTNYRLKENTFRSYLHRMKNAGIIKTAGHVGRWVLEITPSDEGQLHDRMKR